MHANEAESFERRVRLAYANEPCPLDVNPSTIQRFAGFSSFGPVREDASAAGLSGTQLLQLDAACNPCRTAKHDDVCGGTEACAQSQDDVQDQLQEQFQGQFQERFQDHTQRQRQEQEPKLDCIRGTNVNNAFAARLELVSLKKVALHILQRCRHVEAGLGRQSALHHCNLTLPVGVAAAASTMPESTGDSARAWAGAGAGAGAGGEVTARNGGGSVEERRRCVLAERRLMQCRGVAAVLRDARSTIRGICKLPRFLSTDLNDGGDGKVGDAQQYRSDWADPACPHGDTARRCALAQVKLASSALVCKAKSVAKAVTDNMKLQAPAGDSAAQRSSCDGRAVQALDLRPLPSSGGQDSFGALLHRLDQQLRAPEHVRSFIRCALVARGVAKALRIVDALRNLEVCFRHTFGEARAVLADLERLEDLRARNTGGVNGSSSHHRDTEPEGTGHGRAFVMDLQTDAQIQAGAEEVWDHTRQRLDCQRLTLQGVVAALSEVCSALAAVVRVADGVANRGADGGDGDSGGGDSDEGGAAMFVAGAGGGNDNNGRGGSFFTPQGFALARALAPAAAANDALRRACTEGHVREKGGCTVAAARGSSEPVDAWPPPALAARVAGRYECRVCGRRVGKLWISRGVCYGCEAASRARGQCPFCPTCCDSSDSRGDNGSGGSSLPTPPRAPGRLSASGCWCDHASMCAECDAWSCESCRLHVGGDGDDVAVLVAHLRHCSLGGTAAINDVGNQHARTHSPNSHARLCLYLDFDRTLASTRAGADPTKGTHAADEALLELLRSSGSGTSSGSSTGSTSAGARRQLHAFVVTRNQHREQIVEWLRARGVAAAHLRVACVGRRARMSKADVILGAPPRGGGAGAELGYSQGTGMQLGPNDIGVFVDDDIREHSDARLRGCKRLHRVLFSRSAAGTLAQAYTG